MSDEIAYMSEPFFNLIMRAVNRERWKRRRVGTLLDLCLTAIIRKSSLFERTHYLTQNMPKSLAKTLFRFIIDALEAKKKVVAGVGIDFLLQLVNDSFLEFDFVALQQLVPATEQRFENIQTICVLLHHIQRHCLHIEWLRLCWPNELQFAFPCQSVSQWTHLKFLSIKDFICEPKTLRVLSKNHQNLEELEITIFLSEEETSECVGYLTNMKKLRSLSLQITIPNPSFVEQSRFRTKTIVALMANVASRTPSLTNFHFYLSDNFPVNSWKGFVEKFSRIQQEAERVVHLTELELDSLQCEWPKSLTVGKLKIFGQDLQPSSIAKLATIPRERLVALELHGVRDVDVYRILHIFGPTLTQLGLKYGLPNGATHYRLNLYKVVQACPVLQKLFVDEFSTSDRPEDCTLDAESFTNLQVFSIYRTKYDNMHLVYRYENCKLFQMFLHGSKKIDSRVHIYVEEMIPAVLQALQDDQECLREVKDLHIDLQFPQTRIRLVMQIGKILMLRSPVLERIKIWYQYIFDRGTLDIYLENWFMKMAEALDVCLEYEPIYKRPLEWEAYSD
ncbi:uncharacterized protein LOC135941798 [Cloeon dipterum]|uniref:uncharacterized protein LOC135941798 n=1 Tax=Cloeon dipterum TaxID=197152 RepID=UPI00322016E8